MKALCFSLILTALCLTLAAGRAEAWGPDGHAAIGQAAVSRLSARTRARVEDILGVASAVELDDAIAEACFWPDTVRDEPRWAWSAPLHYVNIPREDSFYLETRDCPKDSKHPGHAGGLCVT